MGEEIALTQPQNLKLFEPAKFSEFDQQPQPAKTPNEWFVQRYPKAYENHGSPFLELVQPLDSFTVQVMPITINHDFFASVLGGRKDLGHHVIYFEPEMQFYFRDSDGIYKTTTAEKLANVYRALMMKAAEELPANVHKLNLFHEFRSEKITRSIVQRAKSILAADQSFFSATSPNQRIRGIEMFERIAKRFVDELLTSEPGEILRINDVFPVFRAMLKQKDLPDIKRSDFKAVLVPLIKDQFNVCLRNDLGGSGRGWKGVKMLQSGLG